MFAMSSFVFSIVMLSIEQEASSCITFALVEVLEGFYCRNDEDEYFHSYSLNTRNPKKNEDYYMLLYIWCNFTNSFGYLYFKLYIC